MNFVNSLGAPFTEHLRWLLLDVVISNVIIAQDLLTHFQPVFHFYTPWKHQKTGGFSDVFRGYRNRTLLENGLILRLESLTVIGY